MFDIVDDPAHRAEQRAPLRPVAAGGRRRSTCRFADQLDIVTAVDEYVFGYCQQMRNNTKNDAADANDVEVLDYVMSLVASGDYPQIAAVADEFGVEAGWALIAAHLRDDKRFSRNLERLLDGIEASLPPGAVDPIA